MNRITRNSKFKMINSILNLFKSNKKEPEVIETSRFTKFDIGTKVKFSQKALNQLQEKNRDFFSKHVFQIIDYEISLWEGIRYKLNDHTTLWADEVEKVDINTPLWQ